MPICVAAAGVVTALAIQSFTLAWTHSIEKIRWEEDYRVQGPSLRLVEARVEGSGAGMEPPADSRFENGVWHYDPHLPPLPALRLTLSTYTAGYRLCAEHRCRPLTSWVPNRTGVAEVRVCSRGDLAQHVPAPFGRVD